MVTQYKNKREKLKEYVEFAIEKIADGDARSYNQFLAKVIIETGSKEIEIKEFLNYYLTLRKIFINEKENTITVPEKYDDEIEKEIKEVMKT